MLGCDLHCSYCQNWVTSQALRDPDAIARRCNLTPNLLIEDGCAGGRKCLVSTYNEPLITAEWAVEIFKDARAAGLMTGIRVERERHSPGAGVHPALGGPVQG